MEAYETPVMEVVQIENGLMTTFDDCNKGIDGGGSGEGMDSIRPGNKESL